MDIRSLRAFTAVAESGSFTRASKRLQVSQSAVSQQVHSLEERVGTSLFSRQARQVVLTQAGNVLLPYAKQILAKVEEATAVVSDFEALGRGRVSIGAGDTICHHVLPEILHEFAARFGKIEIQVISGFSVETLKRTVEGTVDVGFVLLPIRDSSVVTTDLGRDELVAIAPRDHAWERTRRVRPRDFLREKLVVYERNSHTFRIIERFLLEAGVFPTIAMEISDLEAVKRMVEAGLGVSVVAAWAVQTELREKTLLARPLAQAGLYRSWGLIRRSNEALTASQRGFISIAKAMFSRLVAQSGGAPV